MSPSVLLRPSLVVLAASLVGFGCRERPTAHGDPAPSTSSTAASPASVAASSASAEPIVGRRVDIDVGEHGFTPSAVDVKKGEPTTLVFTRTSNSTCAFEVVFPDLKLTKELPMKKPVAVAVPVDEARTLAFQCGMGMCKSKVVVQ